jgi:hypothetical protein
VGRDEDPAECHEAFLGHHYILGHQAAGERSMNLNMSLSLAPIVALIAGVLILIVPRLLNYIVAIYLIVTGLLGLFPHLR